METLVIERSGGVVTVTMNRPAKKNAVDGTMWDELREAFREIGRNGDDRVLVLTGAGGDFCSGADLSPDGGNVTEFRAHPLSMMRNVGEVAVALHRLPQPTIAKVRGVAVGAGMNMALGCDLLVCDTTARFAEIFAKRSLSIDFGGSWLLPRRLGAHRAKELALFGEVIDASEAERLGLVNRVVPADELDSFVDGWAARLACGPPIALAMTKRLLDSSAVVSLEQAVVDEGMAQTVNFGSRDTAEALSAFLEKRPPTFHGH